MTSKLIVLALLFAGTAAYATHTRRPEQIPTRERLATLERQLGDWTGRDSEPFSPEILAVLGVDEYLSRFYWMKNQPPVSLYLGYYQSQREGDTIHSPLNCLPGAGWQPIEMSRIDVPVAGRAPVNINRFVIQKGMDRQVVLYWYQSHGRVVASEYWSKAYMVYDAFRLNRSDAALVRVVSPVVNSAGGEAAAERRAIEFVQVLFPQLNRYLPS
jgi:EpsI family protein